MKNAYKPNYERHLQSFLLEFEQEWLLGRLVENDDIEKLLTAALSNSRRHGSISGQRVRTFHANIRSFQLSPRRRGPRAHLRGSSGARGKPGPDKGQVTRPNTLSHRLTRKISYVLRTGRFEQRGDLVAAGGTAAPHLQAAAEALASCSFRSNANLLYEIVYELPRGTAPESWTKTAELLLGDFRAEGCPGLFAIHDRGNPHVHLLVAARPCREVSTDFWVAESQGRPGTPGFRLFDGRQSVIAFRRRLAGIINETCQPTVLFFPGRRSETSLTGIPERRVSRRALKARRIEMKRIVYGHITEVRAKLLGIKSEKFTPAMPGYVGTDLNQKLSTAAPSVGPSRSPGVPHGLPQTAGKVASKDGPSDRTASWMPPSPRNKPANDPVRHGGQASKPAGQSSVPAALQEDHHPVAVGDHKKTATAKSPARHVSHNSATPALEPVEKALLLMGGPSGRYDGQEHLRMRDLPSDEIQLMLLDTRKFQKEIDLEPIPAGVSMEDIRHLRMFLEAFQQTATKVLAERSAKDKSKARDQLNPIRRRRRDERER